MGVVERKVEGVKGSYPTTAVETQLTERVQS